MYKIPHQQNQLVCRGSAIARHIGNKVLEKSHIFKPEIKMYMYEEKFEGRKLTEVVNERHENVKYLPGFKFTDNVVGTKLLPVYRCLRKLQQDFISVFKMLFGMSA